MKEYVLTLPGTPAREIGPFTASELGALRQSINEQLKPGLPDDVQKVIDVVASYFSISGDEIFAVSRREECVWPRQLAMFTIRGRLPYSFKDIGRWFKKDHATVIHACNAVMNRCWHTRYSKDLNAIEALLAGKEFKKI